MAIDAVTLAGHVGRLQGALFQDHAAVQESLDALARGRKKVETLYLGWEELDSLT